MNRRTTFVTSVMSLSLAACFFGNAPPPKYFTLVTPTTHAAKAAKQAEFAIEMLPVDVPEQVDTPLIVVRDDAGQVTPVESRRWIAPLPDELRSAFSNSISAELGARDVNGISVPASTTTYRIKVVVRRFDSFVGARADISATWSVRDVASSALLTCEASASEPASGDYDALALAHQRAAVDIAKKISATIESLHANGANAASATCPPP